jgi:hypothetical protein
MKTYKQFILESIVILERYYEPDEKLPSGKTPVQKATDKSRQRARTVATQSPKNQERWARQYDTTQTKVKHGADNPNLNTNISHRDKDKIKIDKDDSGMSVHHKKSGVTYHVNKSDESDDAHTIAWGHNKNRSGLSPKEKFRTARDAKRVWDKHVSHRLPTGTTVHNTPVGERRKSIYKRAGFGDTDSNNDQFATVKREPSPKQKAKGRTRLKPISPERAKERTNWRGEEDQEPFDYGPYQ